MIPIKIKRLNIYCDGGSRGNPGPAASAFVVLDQSGYILYKEVKTIGKTTNNVAEYMAVYYALKWLAGKRVKEVCFFLDSQLVVRQLSGAYRVKDQKLKKIFVQIKKLIRSFPGQIFLFHVGRGNNKLADALVNKALNSSIK